MSPCLEQRDVALGAAIVPCDAPLRSNVSSTTTVPGTTNGEDKLASVIEGVNRAADTVAATKSPEICDWT